MGDPARGSGTVSKAIDLLDDIASKGRPVRFTEILESNAYPKATLHRHLQTLTSNGLLEHDQDLGVYRLGMRLVRLAHAAWSHSSLADVARPFVDHLANKLEKTVHLGQLDHGQVLYVDKRSAGSRIQMFSDAGKIGPGYCTGIGKAMLAHLPDHERSAMMKEQSFRRYTEYTITNADDLLTELDAIKKAGLSFDREEHEADIICIAAPILSSNGRVLGGLSITTSTSKASLGDLEEYAPDIRSTASDIAQAFEHWRFPEAR